MKSNYQAVLFATDGDYVTDFHGISEKSRVWELINDMGSKWIFYPICFVATKKTIVDAPAGLEGLIGKRISTVKTALAASDQATIKEYLENGWPLTDIITA